MHSFEDTKHQNNPKHIDNYMKTNFFGYNDYSTNKYDSVFLDM